MKTAFFLLLSVVISTTVMAQRKDETQKPLLGTWQFNRQSTINDFQKIPSDEASPVFKTEYFTFAPNGTFTHEMLNAKGTEGRLLKGKWKIQGDKIKMTYSDIDYQVQTTYFFIDNDLVLGQNFNHVILTKAISDDAPYTMK